MTLLFAYGKLCIVADFLPASAFSSVAVGSFKFINWNNSQAGKYNKWL